MADAVSELTLSDLVTGKKPVSRQGSMRDKIELARKSGYSDEEIVGHLSAGEMADKIEQARKAGYGDAEIVEYLGQAPKRSAAEQIGRQIGLTARYGVEGLTAIPNMLGDVAGLKSTQTVSDWLTKFGLPQPEGAQERVVGDVTRAMAGGGGTQMLGQQMVKSAGPVVSRVGDLLTSQRGLQTVSEMTGAGSAGITREKGGGPVAQTIAGVLGGVAPSIAAYAAPATVRGMMRGGEAGRQKTAENVKLFEESGYGTPSVGQATERRIPRAIESTLAKAPGGSGPMAVAAKAGAEKQGQQLTQLADDLSPGATATKAGARIEKGVKSFVDRFRGEQKFLYDKLDAHIPKDKPVDFTNTANALSSLNADIPGAPELSKFFKNATIQHIESAMKSDTKDFTSRLPYEAMKKLRTLVGAELESTNLTSNVPRSKWKALYAALSQDLGEAATEAGPEAQKAFQRANRFTSAGHDRIGTYLDRVAGKDTVEKVFQAAVNPSEIKEGASTINAVMRSIPKDDRKVVQAAFLKRLGAATAGKQDEVGEVFSTETFLTNWNKISPEAKLTLFADGNGELKSNLDKIAKVAANIREGSRVFANPSGTAPAMSTQFASAWTLFSVLTGNFGIAGTIGGAMVGANQSARLMTNPNFVKWLAKATEKPVGAIPAQLNVLANMDVGEDKDAVMEFIEKASKASKAGAR